jgi:hypothetical protein
VPAIVFLLWAAAADAAVLERVEAVGGRRVAVRLHLSGPTAAITQQAVPRVPQPDKIILELPGTTVGPGARGVVSGRGPLIRVRTEQLDGDIARVQLDLQDPVPFSMTNEGSVVTITLDATANAPATPPTIPRVQVPAVGR